MGNGESTSRRISMQRSDTGTIQISENVMLQLKGQDKASNVNSDKVLVKDNEHLISEKELQGMLEHAFQQGKSYGINKMKSGTSTKSNLVQNLNGNDYQQKLHELESFWEKRLAEERERAEKQMSAIKQTYSENDNKSLGSTSSLELQEKVGRLTKENKDMLSKFSKREKELKDEFNHSVQELECKIKPLQQSPICHDKQSKVLECYKLHKQQPLKCSQEVKDFAQCVQSARLVRFAFLLPLVCGLPCVRFFFRE